MKKYEYIHPVDEMEHITRKELGKKFDEILDRIDKENIGFIISDCQSKDEVLCPAHWITFQLDNDFGCIINSAVRYAIGRHTYMPGVVCNFVRKYINILDMKTIEVMIEDINQELKLGIDQESLWIGLRDELIERKNNMKKWEVDKSV